MLLREIQESTGLYLKSKTEESWEDSLQLERSIEVSDKRDTEPTELDHQEEPTGDVETLKSTEEVDQSCLFYTHYNKPTVD